MKRTLCLLIGLCATGAVAGPNPNTNDSVAVALAVPGVRRIMPTSYGYRLETDAGMRTAYRTSTGYYVEGNGGVPAVELRKTAVGFTVPAGQQRIMPTSIGYRLETDAGVRTAYGTSTGYYVEGGGDGPALDVRKVSTGLAVHEAASRSFRTRLHSPPASTNATQGGGVTRSTR